MLGFRILPIPARPPASIVEAFSHCATAHISDNMSRLCGTSGLRAFHRTRRVCGVAFTVKTRAGDNLMIHKAIAIAEPGDVIVVDGGGDTRQALVGELMKMQAEVRRLGGFVIDGAVRDVGAFERGDFPCFARAACHRGPYKEGPGEIGVTVSIDGQVVHPGDIIVGDEDGLVVVRPEEADALLARVRAQAAREAAVQETILADELDRSWIDEALRAKGVIELGDTKAN